MSKTIEISEVMSKTIEIPDEVWKKIIKDVVDEDDEELAKELGGMKYVMVKSYSSGVFAGYLESRNGKEVKLRRSVWLWSWGGMPNFSQLGNVLLTDAIEVIDVTEKARKILKRRQYGKRVKQKRHEGRWIWLWLWLN